MQKFKAFDKVFYVNLDQVIIEDQITWIEEWHGIITYHFHNDEARNVFKTHIEAENHQLKHRVWELEERLKAIEELDEKIATLETDTYYHNGNYIKLAEDGTITITPDKSASELLTIYRINADRQRAKGDEK